jgi:hypothetical protein
LVSDLSLQTENVQLALDRMENIEVDEKSSYIDKNLDGDEYFKDIVGVTVAESMAPKRSFLCRCS